MPTGTTTSDSTRCMEARNAVRAVARNYDRDSNIGKALEATELALEVAWALVEDIEMNMAGVE